jgi:hypothetical protein
MPVPIIIAFAVIPLLFLLFNLMFSNNGKIKRRGLSSRLEDNSFEDDHKKLTKEIKQSVEKYGHNRRR